MERITQRTPEGEYFYPHCFRDDTCGGMGTSEKCECCELSINACKTLGQYEDINLTPEQIVEIDKLYLEKCQEVNRLNAELMVCKESLKRLETEQK